MDRLIYTLKEIPDLTLSKYQSLADVGVDGVVKRHSDFLRLWHGICKESKISMHLAYIFNPKLNLGKRLNVYLIFQGEDNALRLIEPLVNKSPLSEFYAFEKIDKIEDVSFGAGATLMKKERVAKIYSSASGRTSELCYVPHWKINGESRLYDLMNVMQTISTSYSDQSPCAFRIDLLPDTEVDNVRDIFGNIISFLQGDKDIKIINEYDDSKDNTSNLLSKEHEDWLANIETNPTFRMNVFGFAKDVFRAKLILNAASSEAIETGDCSIVGIKADSDNYLRVFSRMNANINSYCMYPQISKLPSWSTTYLLEEVASFFKFPVLYDGENIEIPKETAPKLYNDGLYIGQDTMGYPVYIPLKDLPKHAFFTGMPGSGKTNTMLHIVSQLRRENIPFLAFEPAKKEYRAVFRDKNSKDIFLFSPHLQSYFPLSVNPLEFPVGVRLSDHINALLEVFQGSFVLEGATYKFLSSSIENSYTDLGWEIEDINNGEMSFPSLQDVYDRLKEEIEQSTYDAELKGNLVSFLQVRLGSLMERDAGEVFNSRYSSLSPEEWLHVSAVVELEALNEQAKNFFILLVCHYIFETLRISSNSDRDSVSKQVRHVIFIEEAHNIIASSSQQTASDSVDPKVSATAYIVKMLAEVRALKEAIIIADQLPTALTSEVTKNTGLKLVHRLTSQDDREQIGTSISATPFQLERMASFQPGSAYIHHEKVLKPFEVKVDEWKSDDLESTISNDKSLYLQIRENNPEKYTLDTYIDNMLEKYFFPITDLVTEIVESKDEFLLKPKVMQVNAQISCLERKLIRLENFFKSNDNDSYFIVDRINKIRNDLIDIKNLKILNFVNGGV